MPLTYQIDTERRLVLAQAQGILTQADIAEYQTTVWSRPEVRDFNEIVDISKVDAIDYQSSRQVRELAVLAAEMDTGRTSRLAIVAAEPTAYGIARMYQTYRGLQPNASKDVAVFRSFEEALQWVSTSPSLTAKPDPPH